MSRNILEVKVWGPKESKESKTLNLSQESRSKTASVILEELDRTADSTSGM